MSVDPSAAAAGGPANAALDAIIAAELNALAADAQALQAQIAVNDIIQATVLASNGLTDLLSINGNRVAASLPPTLVPGDTITAQVTGFNGTQIQLRVLATNDPSAAPDPAPPPGAGAPAPPGLGTTPPPAASSAAPPGLATATDTTDASPQSPLAPPVAAFVAASVRPNAPVPPPIPAGTPPPDELTVPPPPPPPAGAVLGGIEARLAAARAASIGPSVPVPQANLTAGAAPAPVPLPASAPSPLAGRALPAAAAPTAAPPPAAAGRLVIPPPIVTSRFVGAAAPAASAAPPATAAAYQDPSALLRALRLPVTQTNLAAARFALESPQRLPAALATLERALPQSDDPRVTSLRTIVGFIGKIEPTSPQLATQIASYVEHVVGGTEPALVQLLEAHQAATPAEAAPAAAPPPAPAEEGAAAPGAAAASAEEAPGAGAPGAAPAAVPTLPVTALGQAAERALAIASSLKTQLFELIAGPAAAGRGGEEVVPAAATVLTAVTGVQLAAAQSAAATPQTIQFAIPMWLGSGYAQAQIAVDRDAPDSTPSVPLDGDNFHIAFILDTKNLGTVAIDLRTVGRAFSLSVKTENLRTAQRFGDELSRLTDRLTSLRYQPQSVEAVVATSPDAAAAESSAVPLPVVATDAPLTESETAVNLRA